MMKRKKKKKNMLTMETTSVPEGVSWAQDSFGPILLKPIVNGSASEKGEWKVRVLGSPTDSYYSVTVEKP
jgi:hypothetical protein